MSIRLTLRAAASSSTGGSDLVGSDGKKTSSMGVGSLPQQPCPSNAPVYMQGDEFPPNHILGNWAGGCDRLLSVSSYHWGSER
jgi:hypothetical protein